MASESLRVFVGNLPWATTEEGLRKAFSACGAVAKAEIAMSKNGQRPRGYGYVTFADEAGVKKAVETMHNQEIEGRPVRVERENTERARAPREAKPAAASNNAAPAAAAAPSLRVYVGNLPFTTTKEELLAAFNDTKGAEDAEIVQFPSGRSKGFGYVQFDSAENVAAAVAAKTDFSLGDRTLRVEAETRTPRAARTRGAKTGRGAAAAGGAAGAGAAPAAGGRRPRNNDAAAASPAAGGAARRPRAPRREPAELPPANPLRVFIGNLPFTITSEELQATFATCGKIVDATIVSNPRGRAKGYGYVTFAAESGVQGALNFNGKDIGGRAVRVEREERRPRRAGNEDPRRRAAPESNNA